MSAPPTTLQPQQAGDDFNYTAPGAVTAARNNNPEFGAHLVQGATDAAAHGDPAKAPSFFQSFLEVLDVVGRCFFPIIGMISRRRFRIGRIICELVSGQDKEHYHLTEELMRLGGDLLSFIPIWGGFASAAAEVGLNWWYGTESKHPSGAQVFGGANLLMGRGWNDQYDTLGYYGSKLLSGASDMFSGFHLGFGTTSTSAAPALPATQQTTYTANGGMPNDQQTPGCCGAPVRNAATGDVV